MPGLAHFLLTSFNVRPDGAPRPSTQWLEHRFALFERFCLPSVAGQTCTDFTWLVRYDDVGTPPEWSSRLRQHEAAIANLELVPGRKAFWQAIEQRIGARAARVLTTRLDNDDALHRDALALLQRNAGGEETTFLNLTHGLCHVTADGSTFRCHEVSNPFISLAETVHGGPPRTAKCVSHHDAAEVAPVVQLGDEPLWLSVIHGRNLASEARGEPCRDADLFAFGVSA